MPLPSSLGEFLSRADPSSAVLTPGLLRVGWMMPMDSSCFAAEVSSWGAGHGHTGGWMSATLQWPSRSSPHTHTTATHTHGSVTHTSVTCTHHSHPYPQGSLRSCGSWLTVARCRYVQHYGLGEACDDVASVLKRVAVRLGKTQKVKVLTGTGETWGLGDQPWSRPGCWGENMVGT